MYRNRSSILARIGLLATVIAGTMAAGCGVRFDMQDQPRYKAYKQNEFFADKLSTRAYPEGTVARGRLNDNKAFYTGKIDNPNPNAVAQTTTDAAGNTVVTSFPDAIDEFPLPVTKELVERGRERYNIYCGVCHGPGGNGDGMIVRRGFPRPPTYHEDRLRKAPVGHFFDVITNGWGRMSSYAYQVQPADRWAIVAYIRALQATQDPDAILNSTAKADQSGTAKTPAAAATTHGGGK